jgi:hypothetical protein
MKVTRGQGPAEKQCSVRHAHARQLLVVATAVVVAIVIVDALYAVFIIVVATLFMSGV